MNWEPENLSETEKAHLAAILPKSQLLFAQSFMPVLEGGEFLVGRHHKLMCSVMDRVIEGTINRLIITVPPGYTKSLLAIILFVCRGMAHNDRSRFLITSYSEKLIHDHSQRIKQVITSRQFQSLWPMALSDDTTAKSLWRTRNEGGLSASPSGGAITGFRAGRMEAGFRGALIIDDPLKPDDAHSETTREFINARHQNTFRSRLATEETPIIVIMQRIHVRDYAGCLLVGESGEKWHHLDLPVWIDPKQEYPNEWTHGIPIKHQLAEGPLWERKHNAKQIEVLKSDPYVFSAQYMQRPTIAGGNVFKGDWFRRYDPADIPVLEYRSIYADTAQKTKEQNDFSVIQEWGVCDGNIYLLDQVRARMEAPELERSALAFWAKANKRDARQFGVVRSFKVEDKSSGTGLIQGLERKKIPIEAIQRIKDKYTRALDVVGYAAAGAVHIPKDSEEFPWTFEYLAELLAFPKGAHDDQVDPTVDAIFDLLINVSFTGMA